MFPLKEFVKVTRAPSVWVELAILHYLRNGIGDHPFL